MAGMVTMVAERFLENLRQEMPSSRAAGSGCSLAAMACGGLLDTRLGLALLPVDTSKLDQCWRSRRPGRGVAGDEISAQDGLRIKLGSANDGSVRRGPVNCGVGGLGGRGATVAVAGAWSLVVGVMVAGASSVLEALVGTDVIFCKLVSDSDKGQCGM